VGSSGAGTPAVYAAAAMTEPILSPDALQFLAGSRRATLATIDDLGRPRLVPICFVVSEDRATEAPVIHTPLDEKPKRDDDPLGLARVRDIRADPRVSVLVDRWDEDWTRLAWVRVEGTAGLLGPSTAAEHARVVAAIRARYPQYANHRLEERPIIRIAIERATDWGRLTDMED
jgi:PPOX class probable F420-dependent enzyme